MLRGAMLVRYSTKMQQSDEDQVRVCQEWADRNNVYVAPELLFSDRGVSGRKNRRAGLDGLRNAIREKRVDVVIAVSPSRLFRKSYKALQFIEEEIIDHRLRAVFPGLGIDTANPLWRQQLPFQSLMDENLIQMIAHSVHAAHERMFDEGYVHGTVTYGYTGVEVEGRATKRGRKRSKLTIDEEAAKWVRLILEWFTNDR